MASCIIMGLLFSSVGRTAFSDEAVSVTEAAPNVVIFETTSGNVIASIGREGALLVGTPSAGSTAFISRFISARTRSTVRYIVVGPQGLLHTAGDAGWGKLGAFVVMHEKALERLGGHAMGPPAPLSPRLTQLGSDRPRVSFSDVLSFDLNGESVHIVHQDPGYSDADAVTHFHAAQIVYLGELFPGDGYPEIDLQQGGNLEGLLKSLVWTDRHIRVLPARGKMTNGSEVAAFREMIVSVRGDVSRLISAGKTEEQIIAIHPTARFDGRWGNGRIRPDIFVHEVYNSLSTRR